MRVYGKQHYEDVAELLHGYRPLPQVPIKVLIEAFANLFATDDPPIWGKCCGHPECDSRRLVGGFDRERFLKACGLEMEKGLQC